MARTGVSFADVDRVFLTGGSSFIPVIRRPFSDRFGEDKLRTGGELTSVASGLALAARAAAGVIRHEAQFVLNSLKSVRPPQA